MKFFYNLAELVFELFCESRRILATSAKFCLNSLFATWSYRYPNPKHVIQRALTLPSSPTQVFWRKKFLQNPCPSPSCYHKISLKRFWDRFSHFSVSLIRPFGEGGRFRGEVCFRANIDGAALAFGYRKTLRYNNKLKMYSEHTFWCPEMRKNLPTSLRMACIHRFFISSSSGNLKNPIYSAFGPTRPLCATPCFLRCLLSLVLVNSAQVSTARPPFMNKAYYSRY